MVAVQFAMLFVIPKLPWYLVIGIAYCFGGVINHSLMLGIICPKRFLLTFLVTCFFSQLFMKLHII